VTHRQSRYKPGDVVIFLAGDLYHGVGEWKPSGKPTGHNITPGRIGHVFFTPARTLEKLWGKPPKWFTSTFGGLWPDVNEPPDHSLAQEAKHNENDELRL